MLAKQKEAAIQKTKEELMDGTKGGAGGSGGSGGSGGDEGGDGNESDGAKYAQMYNAQYEV